MELNNLKLTESVAKMAGLPPLGLRKCAVWIKDGKIAQERWAFSDQPTMWTDVPGCLLYIASYDIEGKIEQVDLYNEVGMMVSADPKGVVISLPGTTAGGKTYPEDKVEEKPPAPAFDLSKVGDDGLTPEERGPL